MLREQWPASESPVACEPPYFLFSTSERASRLLAPALSAWHSPQHMDETHDHPPRNMLFSLIYLKVCKAYECGETPGTGELLSKPGEESPESLSKVSGAQKKFYRPGSRETRVIVADKKREEKEKLGAHCRLGAHHSLVPLGNRL